MVRLDEKAEVNLLNSNGDVISFRNNSVLISVDTPKDGEIRRGSKCSFTSENCIFDNRTIDYICGFLSTAEYKMPKKNHRKQKRTRKRFKKTQRIILGKYHKC